MFDMLLDPTLTTNQIIFDLLTVSIEKCVYKLYIQYICKKRI